MQPPQHPRGDEIPPFHEPRRHQRPEHGHAPHPHPHHRHNAAAAQGVVDGPHGREIHRREEVADRRVRENRAAEDVEHKVAVVGKKVRVEIGVLFDGHQDHGQGERRLQQRAPVDGDWRPAYHRGGEGGGEGRGELAVGFAAPSPAPHPWQLGPDADVIGPEALHEFGGHKERPGAGEGE